ncbi:hypothetical protein EDB85DRAFT_1552818 [Lactarius pseudohatsudake]|nr:hypothetical protein EDB85DRAFT_1552818 [Lactarius pseudohatsudake]
MIGGSEAAFIVVVIVLAAIVILASIAIYCLLRKGEPSAAERAARRKYSIRGRGVRTHALPIGLPGSLSEKIGSVFKGRRTGSGWEPAHDEADEWDSTDEPLRVHRHHDDPYEAHRRARMRYGSTLVMAAGRGGLGSVGTGNDTSPMGYYAPQPRRADSGPEIPLFAGSTPFRHDI